MKKILIIIFLSIACTHYQLLAQVFQNKVLTISELEKNTWVVETTDNTTMYIIEGYNKAMLIDTGTKCEKLDEVVRQITQKPLYVVITHIHVDHAGNIEFFDNIYFHPDDSVLMDRLGKKYEGTVNFIEDGHVFDLGNRPIEVTHMPGHTPGSIVLLDPATGNCYSGDAFGSGMVWLQLWPFSPMSTYINSLKKMESIMDNGISKIYCGHYPYVKKYYSKDYITAMRELAEKIDEGFTEKSKPFEIKIPGIGCENPMILTKGEVSIVYDPEHVKF